MYDKKRNYSVQSLYDQLQLVENEGKYDVLANKMAQCKTRIIPYVIDLKYNKISYTKEISLTTKIEAFIQFIK